MKLNELLPQLEHRVQRECSTSEVDTTYLEDMLDRARYEYSRYNPRVRTFDFALPNDSTLVTVLDDQQEPAQVVAAVGAYIKDYAPSAPLGQGRGAPPPTHGGTFHSQRDWHAFTGEAPFASDVREMPSILFTEARYRDFYYQEVSYYRSEHVFTIIRPPALRGTVEGVIVYGAVRDWDELPQHDQRLILDRALAEFIDDTLVGGQAGLVRIPSPHGSFEFDGGRVLLALRDRLIERFEGQLHTRMSHLSQG